MQNPTLTVTKIELEPRPAIPAQYFDIPPLPVVPDKITCDTVAPYLVKLGNDDLTVRSDLQAIAGILAQENSAKLPAAPEPVGQTN